MNNESYKSIESAIRNNGIIRTRKPDDVKHIPFLDIFTSAPSEVLNALHKEGLLDIQSFDESCIGSDSVAPAQLALKYITGPEQPIGAQDVIMTFLDRKAFETDIS
jgi:hypothetical protein